MPKRRALIAGITGQDGSYLAELLLEKGYEVSGLTRDPLARFTPNIAPLKGRVDLRYCAYTESAVIEAVQNVRPHEIYNFGAQVYVAKSWELIPETVHHTGVIPTYFLEAIIKADRKIKFFQASSSEIYTPKANELLTEESPIDPSNPYGCSKAFAHQMVAMFRKQHKAHFVNGIFFNHESPRRNEDFLSRKLVRAAVAIQQGRQKELVLGNLKAARVWGYAPDFVDAAYRMMQLDEPRDLIICAEKLRTVEDMIAVVFAEVGLDWKDFVRVDPKLFRPFETPVVRGSHKKLTALTGWKPTTSFEAMLKLMIQHEREQPVENFA
jgi:GDPmannose 4,6-dehydratase